MKTKEFLKEIKELADTDLYARCRQTAEELMKLRFRASTGQLEQNHRLREGRKNLARMMGELNKRKAASAASK
jgi:large subunit ribosomal protein L29